jgi:hypothetical protein
MQIGEATDEEREKKANKLFSYLLRKTQFFSLILDFVTYLIKVVLIYKSIIFID